MSDVSDPEPLHGRPHSAPSAAAEPGGRLVLVAEDEETSRDALLEVLRDAGYRTIGVRDGLELVEVASQVRPDVVVMDLAMPRLDGIEAASMLRRSEWAAEIPIVAVTASWLAERGDLLTEAGFDAALRKPCSGERLLTELRRVLSGEQFEQEVGV